MPKQLSGKMGIMLVAAHFPALVTLLIGSDLPLSTNSYLPSHYIRLGLETIPVSGVFHRWVSSQALHLTLYNPSLSQTLATTLYPANDSSDTFTLPSLMTVWPRGLDLMFFTKQKARVQPLYIWVKYIVLCCTNPLPYPVINASWF